MELRPVTELMPLLVAFFGLCMRSYSRFERLTLLPAKQALGPARLPIWLPWLEHGAMLMIIGGVLRHFVFSFVFAHGQSMAPSIDPGAVILVDRTAYGVRLTPSFGPNLSPRLPTPGDIVIVQFRKEYKLAKRVIAIEGDEVRMVAGRIWVNGQQIPREDLGLVDASMSPKHLPVPPGVHLTKERMGSASYQVWAGAGLLDGDEVPATVRNDPARWPCTLDAVELKCKIPQGRFFALGDNREFSADSRQFGLFESSTIIGRAVLTWSPRSEAAAFKWLR